ncbi:universal stress protein [Rasiella sp. SM2506]|uniref:universal stress protein n=1 Tax=Rasiella sp. SM2506 TaxID=3423914 RepID=UPI003D7B7A0F
MNLPYFSSIGIGVTFSPNLKANLYEAARLSMLFDSKLILIHVGVASEEKTNKFQEILAPFFIDGLTIDIVYAPGEPVASILKSVNDKKINLLILGALQRENFFKYYVGSIARKITRSAKCSVLLLINPSIKRIKCKHIVVNGLKDKKTEQAIKAAFFVANALQAEQLTIVEEITQQEVAISINDDKSLRLATLKKEKLRRQEDSRIKNIISTIPEKHKKDLTIRTQPIFGKRGYSIGHFAKVARADLLVMNGPNKSGFIDRLFPHDIEHILTELPTDVLIIQ